MLREGNLKILHVSYNFIPIDYCILLKKIGNDRQCTIPISKLHVHAL